MSFSPAFTVSQTPLSAGTIIFSDVSTGSDGAIAGRRIYIQNSQGQYVVVSGNPNNYTTWPLASNPFSVNILENDTAANTRIDWVDSGGNVLYTSNNNFCYAQYSKNFLYYLVQMQSETYSIVQDSFYWGNTSIFYANLIGAINAVEVGSDISAAQACLDRDAYMILKQSDFF